MTVTLNIIDTWLQHLPFTGPRPSLYGPVDGVWYGHAAVAGDGSGGQVHVHGIVSERKKTDWVYIMGGATGASSSSTAMDALVNVASGPLIPDLGVSINEFVSMTKAGALLGTNLGGFMPMSGSLMSSGMPVFGDPHISGDFNILSADFGVNVNAAVYRLDAWGFLVRYNSFFRGVPAALA